MVRLVRRTPPQLRQVRELGGQVVKLQNGALAVAQWECRASFHEVAGEAVDAALGELRR
jgi:hypothetical protein